MDLNLDQYDWLAVHGSLDAKGYALLPGLLTALQCRDTAAMFDDDGLFRSHIHMDRYNFGRGEYKYARLALIANIWTERLKIQHKFPTGLSDFIDECHVADQKRPTPLLLRYVEGDFNCLHQDLYGRCVFPLQVIVMLSERDRDFVGGELMLVENRPRMQSVGHVVSPRMGDAVIVAVNQRPQRGAKGDYRVAMRHGVAEIKSGMRQTLGIIMHDAA
jgi:uncharacterized protein